MLSEALSEMEKDRLLSEKFVEVDKLRDLVKKLQEALDNEMEANEKLNDLNVNLKGQIREMRHNMKVRAHPSSMRHLQDIVEQQKDKINTLRQTIELSLRLIPENRMTKPHLTTINMIYQRVF